MAIPDRDTDTTARVISGVAIAVRWHRDCQPPAATTLAIPTRVSISRAEDLANHGNNIDKLPLIRLKGLLIVAQ